MANAPALFEITAIRGKPMSFRTDALIARIREIQYEQIAVVADKINERDPKRTSISYKRTYELNRSFDGMPNDDTANTLTMKLINLAVDKYGRYYASYVVGSTRFKQARVHQGWWPVARDVAKETLPEYRSKLREALRDIIS